MSRNRYPPLLFGPNGQRLCRGCGDPVPKGRFTWCSQRCYDYHDWRQVCRRVWHRDGGECQLCHRNIGELKQEWMDRYEAWRSEYPARRALGLKGPALWKFPEPSPNPQFDHIIPWIEGGSSTDENIRLTCTPCHIKRTSEWRRARRQRGQLALEITEAGESHG